MAAFVVIFQAHPALRLVPCVSAPMGYKHRARSGAAVARAAEFLIKIIPHVGPTPRICELARSYCEDVTVKGAWTSPTAIELFERAMSMSRRGRCVRWGPPATTSPTKHIRTKPYTPKTNGKAERFIPDQPCANGPTRCA